MTGLESGQGLAQALGNFPTGNLCNAHPQVRAMTGGLALLFAGAKLSGPALTAKTPPGQNAAIHRAVHGARPGQVLVVETGGDTAHGPFGDILATCCRNQGIAGLVIDGTIRDSGEIRKMGFPVFCRGANPAATAKTEPGQVGVQIHCGGAAVRPGDFIVGDDDGVVVVPAEIARDVAEKAAAVAKREAAIMARLVRGETTFEIFELGTPSPSES